MIYLDYNATTPIDPKVAEAMKPYLDVYFGNPSSSHVYGSQTKMAVEKARKQIAEMINAETSEIIFTSGGTESNNYALKGAAIANREKGNHIITTSIEHPAIFEVCKYLEKNGFEVTYLGVDEFGIIDAKELEKSIKPETILISVMHANNEVGSIQPIKEIGVIAKKHGILFHSDAAQSVGKESVDVKELGLDLLSIAGHKLYAPKGIGVIFIREGVVLEKLIHGADHEQNMRAGTENVLEIVGLGKSAELVTENIKNYRKQYAETRDLLEQLLKQSLPQIKRNGHQELCLPNTLSISFPKVEANTLISRLEGVAASAGAACHAESIDVSMVLEAMNVPLDYAMGTIRFSTGRSTTKDDIIKAAEEIIEKVSILMPKDDQVDTSIRYTKNSDPSEITKSSSKIEETDISILGRTDTIEQLPKSPKDEAAVIPLREVKLTNYTHGLGCACKIKPQNLEKVLKSLPQVSDPRVLVGTDTSDDAAVYKLTDDLALVQTLDFFTPIVDNPFQFGAIAAANALSDIYAMGATPSFALNIVGFPEEALPLEVLEEILLGAQSKAEEAGIPILGGHTIEDPEPKYGMVVSGLVHPEKLIKNTGARVGDVLVLTKPLGTGIISTGIKRGVVSEEVKEIAINVMSSLNKVPAEVMMKYDVSACTDVTGFGLMGHLKEMVGSSKITAEIKYESIPFIDTTKDLAAAGIIPGGSYNNREYVDSHVDFGQLSRTAQLLICDAQTSGGLLVVMPENQASLYMKELEDLGMENVLIIGEIVEKGAKDIQIV